MEMEIRNMDNKTEEEESEVFDDPRQERQLILIGKTGNGKSSVGNIILGRRHFPVGFSMTSTTVTTASGSVDFRRWKIKVLDTPDISNLPNIVDEDQAQQEVSRWKSLASPGAHAILLAVRCDVRYTREEYEIFLQLKNFWGGKPLTRRLIVAFTFGDRQDKDIEEDLRLVCPELKNVLTEASQRYVVFNDRDDAEGKERQVLDLMDMVDRLDAQVLREENERLLKQPQVCPMGPALPSNCSAAFAHLQRTSSGRSSARSSASRGSSSTDPDYIRLVLVGKPRTGKSSTGNTILGQEAFPVHKDSSESLHASCRNEVVIDGKTVQVIDTPGLQVQSSGLSTQDKDYQREKRRASDLTTPGPHALLYVVRHRDVTQEDLNGFQTFKQNLGQGLSQHTIIVLTGVRGQRPPSSSSLQNVKDVRPPSRSEDRKPSSLSSSPLPASPGQGRKHPSLTALEEAQVAEEGEMFQRLLQEAGSKLWMVDNLSETGVRQQQVSDLMGLVQVILKNSKGNYFPGDKAASERNKRRSPEDNHRGLCWFL